MTTDAPSAGKKHNMEAENMTRKLPKILSEEEILKLFEITYNPQHRLQLKLLYYCGLRISEMLSLKKQDLDFKDEILKVVQGKGGKDRLVPLPKPLLADLQKYVADLQDHDKLFDTTARNTQAVISRLGKKLSKKLHAHMLRHSYATHVLEKTNNLELVRDLLGHSNIQTTQIYTHLTTKAKKAGINEVWK